MEVEYREIAGFPAYRIGNDGTVWTCWKSTGASGGHELSGKWKILKGGKRIVTGHRKVILCDGTGRRKYAQVHRLVLESFVGPCPEGMEACHFPDRNPANNNLNNLRWDTKKANADDRVIHGTSPVGELHPMAILTDAIAADIKRKLRDGLRQCEIARLLGISKITINHIARGRQWKHVNV
jgi:hypothetical protein